MKKYIFCLAFLITLSIQAQDKMKKDSAEISIIPIFHSTMVIEWDGYIIFVDPYNGAGQLAPYGSADLILITHQHPDHLDLSTLVNLDYEDAKVIAPPIVMMELDTLLFEEKIVLKNGEKKQIDLITVEAIPMYNLPLGSGGHKKGEGNGYLLTIGGKRIYIAGDTEDIPEMRKLKNIDIAFIPMNLPYTMTEEQAAEAVLAFKPKVVYPFHYRGKEEMSDPEKFKSLVEEKNKDIEVRIEDWYPSKVE